MARTIDTVVASRARNLPTSAHFKYFLASLYDVTNSKAEELYTSYCRDTPRSSEDPSYLPFKPSMVILHSPSLYLAENTLAESVPISFDVRGPVTRTEKLSLSFSDFVAPA